MSPEIWIQLALAVGSGAGVYAAIRADLARLHERVNVAYESAKAAHSRIDENFYHGRKS